MLVLKLEGAPTAALMPSNGIIQLTWSGDFVSHLWDELTNMLGMDGANDFATSAYGEDGFSLEKPLAVCFWSLEEKKAVVAAVRKIRLTNRVISTVTGEALPVCMFYTAEIHQPRLSEILNAFTSSRIALL